jgi:hypothetical protein
VAQKEGGGYQLGRKMFKTRHGIQSSVISKCKQGSLSIGRQVSKLRMSMFEGGHRPSYG